VDEMNSTQEPNNIEAMEKVNLVEKIEKIETPGDKPISRLREYTRAIIVFSLILCVVGVFLVPLTCNPISDNYWNLTDKLLTALIGLLGTAIGFYFRSKD
jgi:hypothetical protein